MLGENNNNARNIHSKPPLKMKRCQNLIHNYFDKFPKTIINSHRKG